MNQLFMSPLFTVLSAHGSGKMGSATILENDPYGLTVALISVSVVLSALIVLGTLIWVFSKAMIYVSRQQAEAALRKQSKKTSAEITEAELDVNGEVIAAITYAIKLHKGDLHDRESEVVTINSVARAYSPWSSKIHGLTNMPR